MLYIAGYIPEKKEEAKVATQEERAENWLSGQLLVDAGRGIFWGLVALSEYCVIWFLLYPLGLFLTVEHSLSFYAIPLNELDLFAWANILITGAIGFYFAFFMLAPFITLHRDSYEYRESRGDFRNRIFVYLCAVHLVAFDMAFIGAKDIYASPDLFFKLKVFYLVYAILFTLLKSYYKEIVPAE